MRNPLSPSLLPIALALCSTLAAAQLDQAVKKADDALDRDASALSNEKIISGLKQALQVSTAKAIALTGKHDGFLQNEQIRILLPPKLQSLGKGMRMLGMGEQVDDLEIGMNRAAEQATPLAKPFFLAALKKLTFSDARRILTGNETAATDYFRSTSSNDLTAAFTPIVHRSLERVGVVRQYNSVINQRPAAAPWLASLTSTNTSSTKLSTASSRSSAPKKAESAKTPPPKPQTFLKRSSAQNSPSMEATEHSRRAAQQYGPSAGIPDFSS